MKPKKYLFSLVKPYWWMLGLVLVCSLASNGLTLWLPKIGSGVVDSFNTPNFLLGRTITILIGLVVLIFIFSLSQSFLQTLMAESLARDLRSTLMEKVSRQNFVFVGKITQEKLLTVLTSDVDNIKQAMTMGLVQIFSSIVMIVGATVLLLSINVKLALMVLVIVPIIGVMFFTIFKKIGSYFKKSQEVIDRLNKVINESIVAAGLVRVLNSQVREIEKFNNQNSQAKNIGMSILKLFSTLIPLINFLANMAIVLILLVGGKFVLGGTFTVGNLLAFSNYVYMLIFPVIVLGFISNILARAGTSFQRVMEVLGTADTNDFGNFEKELEGKINFKNVSLSFGQKEVLKNVTFEVTPGKRTAILGPTGAGKTQLFYLMSGLINPDKGKILIDDVVLKKYSQKCLSEQIGLVFQDSSIFNTSLRENINFGKKSETGNLDKVLETSALKEFVESLPEGLETEMTERGSNLSGGQKQRLTLARALAINPKILLLDDFTARVDKATEKEILNKLMKNYQGITQIMIAQQINSVIDFDQIIFLMEGEILACGTHKELMKKCPEYGQLYSLQMSTE
jgi:ATP-binding cassette subfamily B protein